MQNINENLYLAINNSFKFSNPFYKCLQKKLKSLLEEHFKSDVEYTCRDPLLFGDFRTALDEGEPRLYEDIQDYEAAKALFQEVGRW